MKRITFTADNDTALAVVSLLIEGSAIVGELHITEESSGAAPKAPAGPSPRHPHHRQDGKSAVQVLAEKLKPGTTFTQTDFRRTLNGAGFADGTARSVLSTLMRNKYVEAAPPVRGQKAYRVGAQELPQSLPQRRREE